MKLYDSGKPQAEMTIAVKDGVKVIHHPTGIVQELTKTDLLARKAGLESQQAWTTASLVAVGKAIADCTATAVPAQGD